MKQAGILYGVVLAAAFAMSRCDASVYNVRDYGAKGDGVTKDTHSIQRAIDAAYNAGGGTVELSPGTYLSGSLFLRSNVDFNIGAGATLKASPDPADYNAADVVPQNGASPKNVDNTSGGHLILCVAQTNVVLRGFGKIDGNSDAFLLDEKGRRYPSKKAIKWRPAQMLWFVDSCHVKIRDLEIASSPYWTCFLLNCTHVAVTGCHIRTNRKPHTFNGDGIDIDRCRYVTVSDCRIDTSDDCITLRASSASRLANPQDCAWVSIANCVLSTDCNAVRIGVGEGRIHHAVLSNLVIENAYTAFNYVGAYSRSSRGTDITDIRVSNVAFNARRFVTIHHMHSDDAVFGNLYFSDISGSVKGPSYIYASPKTPFGAVRFRNIDVPGGYEAVNAPDVRSEGGSFSEIRLSDAERAARCNAIKSRKGLLY